jgi:tubulin polyglutamylase TTLL9
MFITSEQEAISFNQKTMAKVATLDAEEKQKLWYVIQRYIQNPFLVGGRKFDIRLYALTLCFQPLIIYVYRGGFCRFSSQPFSLKSFQNREVHLTNIAVQTHSAAYNARSGAKWDTDALRTYLTNRFGATISNQMFTAIQGIILNSLLSVASSVINDKHCYELYGYDVLIADDLRPWLIEINASPSLDANTEDDYDLKYSFLYEMLDLVQIYHGKTPDQDLPLHYGGYDLVWNGGPVVGKNQSLITSFIGCNCPVIKAAHNPYRTESKFRVKKPHPPAQAVAK